MVCDMIVILKDTDTTNMSDLVKIIEEKDSAPKCSNCANCTKNRRQDNLYPYCSRRDMFLMNTDKSAEDCAFYEVKGLNLSFKSFFAIMLVVTIILGVY